MADPAVRRRRGGVRTDPGTAFGPPSPARRSRSGRSRRSRSQPRELVRVAGRGGGDRPFRPDRLGKKSDSGNHRYAIGQAAIRVVRRPLAPSGYRLITRSQALRYSVIMGPAAVPGAKTRSSPICPSAASSPANGIPAPQGEPAYSGSAVEQLTQDRTQNTW